jgi:phage baseplate assembly protein W
MVTLSQAELTPAENLGMDIEMINGDMVIGSNNDFSVAKYEKNLGQAVKHRLLTVVGELRLNPAYGSELPLYLGISKNESVLTEIEGVIYKTLLQEPRIKEVVDIVVSFDEIDVTKVNVNLSILPIDYNVPMNLVYELFV